jgi:hypothetical protein
MVLDSLLLNTKDLLICALARPTHQCMRSVHSIACNSGQLLSGTGVNRPRRCQSSDTLPNTTTFRSIHKKACDHGGHTVWCNDCINLTPCKPGQSVTEWQTVHTERCAPWSFPACSMQLQSRLTNLSFETMPR